MTALLETIEIETQANPSYSIIWMHGLGADGNDFVPIIPELHLQDMAIRFIFPNAPMIPVTLNNGYVMRAWYDIAASSTDILKREDEGGLRQSQQAIQDLIARENERGIPSEKIVLAGFSQGCAMALQTGLRHTQKLAGMMGLSGYLPLSHKVGDEISASNQSTPIFLAHGTQDMVVPCLRGEQSKERLKQLGYTIEWHTYWMQHSVSPQEIEDISIWLRKVLK